MTNSVTSDYIKQLKCTDTFWMFGQSLEGEDLKQYLKHYAEADDIILKHIGFMSTRLVETMQISWSLQHLKIKWFMYWAVVQPLCLNSMKLAILAPLHLR